MNSVSISKGRFIAIIALVSCLATGRVGAISPQDSANMEAARNVASTRDFLVDMNRTYPILFLVGDSTMHNPQKTERSWGDVITKYFNTNQIRVENHALGGRSSRTFITQGWWDKVLDAAKPGDYVIVQLGTNDGGPLDDTNRARGSIGGIGEEETNLYNPVMKKMETVHTYGWYLRKYITDARAKGMITIICSPIPHVPKAVTKPGDVENWKDVGYAGQVATNENVLYINLNQIVISHYAGMTPQDIKAKYFTPADNTHTSPAGAEVNAISVIEGIQSLTNCPLQNYLLPPQHSGTP